MSKMKMQGFTCEFELDTVLVQAKYEDGTLGIKGLTPETAWQIANNLAHGSKTATVTVTETPPPPATIVSTAAAEAAPKEESPKNGAGTTTGSAKPEKTKKRRGRPKKSTNGAAASAPATTPPVENLPTAFTAVPTESAEVSDSDADPFDGIEQTELPPEPTPPEGDDENKIDMSALVQMKRFGDVLGALYKYGYKDPDSMAKVCIELQDKIPVLSAYDNLEQRIRHAFNVVVSRAG